MSDGPIVAADVVSREIDVHSHAVRLLEGGAGAPLLVLHSAGGGGIWSDFHAGLAETFHVIAPDAPGFGGTPEYDDIEDVQDIAYLYASLIDVLGLARVAVLGTSFGGWIAAELALVAGDKIDQLVLMNALGLRIPGAPVADLFAMSPPRKAAALFHDAEMAQAIFGGTPDLETIMQFYRNDKAFARFAWEPFCCNPKLMRRLPHIRARTLVLLGAEDRVVPRAHGEAYAAGIPRAELVIVPDTGHALSLEKTDAAIAAVRRFLA